MSSPILRRALAWGGLLAAFVWFWWPLPEADFDDEESTPEAPAVLRVGFVPSHEDPERVMNSFELLRTYLEARLDMPVSLRETGTYAPAIEAMRAHKMDVVYLPPFAYLLASERANAEAVVVRGTRDDGPGAYNTLLITHPGSGIETVDDIIARASTLSLTFTDPASTSGHLIPRAFLESHGLMPERDFRRVLFAMNHSAAVLTVASGRVDLAAISINAYNRLLERGRISEETVRIVWRSPRIPSGAIAVRGGLPEPLKAAIQAAFVALPDEAPEVWEHVSRQYIDSHLIYLAGDDSVYDELRTIGRSIENMRLLR